MKSTFLILFLLTIKLSLCQEISDDDFFKYPLKSITSYCQKDTSKIISKKVLTYNKANKIEKSSSFENDTEIYRTIYNYNDKGLLVSKDFYNVLPDIELKRTRLFEYNQHNKLIYEGFDDNRGNNTKNSYQYNSNGLLIESTTKCNYTNWEYSYEYNSNDLLIGKFKNGELEITYEYHNGLLTKQTNINSNKDIVFTFEYSESGKLLVKKENNKIVQRNIYLNGYLIKTWTYYFGIDPCYDICCSQYLVRYDYN